MESANMPFSQACANNREPILAVLRDWLSNSARVLEIGTGTGQHAEFFAARLSHLSWLPSDHPDALWQSKLRLEQAEAENLVLPVLPLDVADHPWPEMEADAAFSANTAHIMSWPEVEAMFTGVGRLLPPGGCFCLYGPFNEAGQYTSESNRRFDEWLRGRSPSQGIRNLEALQALAARHDLSLEENRGMPANNQLLLWRRVSH